jgi:type IV secretory pathway TraG/TraD family ATPase VirD4
MATKRTISWWRVTDLLGPADLSHAVGDGRLVLGVAAAVLAVAGVWKAARRGARETYKRGVVLGSAPPCRRKWLLRAPPDLLTVGGVGIPALDETKHFKFIGTTGTGKSTAIRALLHKAIRRGDRAVFADPDGGYCRAFYNRYRGDIILNPFDSDSVRWDLFAEIQDHYDAEQLASGLIPDCEDAAAREWRGYARTFLATMIRRCHAGNVRSAEELWRLLTAASPEELRPWVGGTPAQTFLEGDNARMFGSIRAVLVSAIAGFEFVQSQRAAGFSVREWVRESHHCGNLFIPYKANQIAALRSMIATWMRLAIFEAMSQPEGRDQHLWFVVDELDALGAIDGLKDALARLRKFGGRCVLGFQSVAQVSGTYGQAAAQTVIENCANSLIFRCSSSENGGTSQFASRLIGDREVLRLQTSRGSDREGPFSAKGSRRSRNVTEQCVTEAAVMPSELEQLPDLVGYLKTASSPAWRKVRLDPHAT